MLLAEDGEAEVRAVLVGPLFEFQPAVVFGDFEDVSEEDCCWEDGSVDAHVYMRNEMVPYVLDLAAALCLWDLVLRGRVDWVGKECQQ